MEQEELAAVLQDVAKRNTPLHRAVTQAQDRLQHQKLQLRSCRLGPGEYDSDEEYITFPSFVHCQWSDGVGRDLSVDVHVHSDGMTTYTMLGKSFFGVSAFATAVMRSGEINRRLALQKSVTEATEANRQRCAAALTTEQRTMEYYANVTHDTEQHWVTIRRFNDDAHKHILNSEFAYVWTRGERYLVAVNWVEATAIAATDLQKHNVVGVPAALAAWIGLAQDYSQRVWLEFMPADAPPVASSVRLEIDRVKFVDSNTTTTTTVFSKDSVVKLWKRCVLLAPVCVGQTILMTMPKKDVLEARVTDVTGGNPSRYFLPSDAQTKVELCHNPDRKFRIE